MVKFSKDGKYLMAWGKKGSGPGEFDTPHSIAVDSKGTVYVSDRENNRIQIFDANGKFLRQFTHLGATQNVFITPKDEMWIITHRNNIENITYDTLAGRIMRIDTDDRPHSGIDGESRALVERHRQRRDFHRQPDGQCLSLVPRMAGPGSRFRRRSPAA